MITHLHTPPYINSQRLITDLYQSLYSAIEMDSANEVKQFGADINYRYEGGKTPLMLASSMGSIDTIRALLELGANRSLVSEENMIAIDYAKSKQHKHITEILKADKEIISNNNDLKVILAEEIPIAETFPVAESEETSIQKQTLSH